MTRRALASFALAGLAICASLPAAAMAADGSAVTIPGVLEYEARASGVEYHLAPGQYPQFSNVTVSLPLVTGSGDSSPSTSSEAAVADLGQFDNYPAASCLLFAAYYCPYFSQLPLNTYVARADSGAPGEGSSTSFPCDPAQEQPSSSAIPLAPGPVCGPVSPGVVDGSAQAVVTPNALISHSEARAGPLSVSPAPGAAAAGYRQSLQQLRSHLLARGVRGARLAPMEAAASTGAIATIGGMTTITDLRLDPQSSKPVATSTVTLTDVDLAGILDFALIRIHATASTLGEVHPAVTPSVQYGGVSVLGRAIPDAGAGIDACNQALQTLYYGDASNGYANDLLYNLGFNFYCSRVNPGGDTLTHPQGSRGGPMPRPNVPLVNRSNPNFITTYLDIDGPGFDFTQQTDRSANNSPDSACSALSNVNGNPGYTGCANYQACANLVDPRQSSATVPSGVQSGQPQPSPITPAAGLPALPDTSPAPPAPIQEQNGTCQFVSAASFYRNAFSLRLGHLTQTLGALPAVPRVAGCGSLNCLGTPGVAPTLPVTLVIPGRSGTSAIPGVLSAVKGAGATSPFTAGKASRRGPVQWVVYALGAWGSAVLAAIYTGAAIVNRRRSRWLR